MVIKNNSDCMVIRRFSAEMCCGILVMHSKQQLRTQFSPTSFKYIVLTQLSEPVLNIKKQQLHKELQVVSPYRDPQP